MNLIHCAGQLPIAQEHLHLLARLHAATGKLPQALADLLQFQRIFPLDYRGSFEMGKLYSMQGEFELAERLGAELVGEQGRAGAVAREDAVRDHVDSSARDQLAQRKRSRTSSPIACAAERKNHHGSGRAMANSRPT